ncbi:unnamed protein product [Cladocopium goreaui]|uniref:Sperm motility kinase 1 n=1 Tax=Cladocopium goreaui TaxID=2562237 RepID=A0A9P1CTM7_9DINO|nr:unnamed protein product [Cladocopium goreaui]
MTEGMETIETRNADGARKDATESTQLLKQRNNGTATGAQLMLNIVVCGLGTGLFTLPWSVAGASCFLGVAIVAFVLALNAWTIFLLVEAAEAYQAFDIGSLLSHLPGQLGHTLLRVVNFTIWVGGFFCLVSYVIVIADCAAPFAQLGPWIVPAAFDIYLGVRSRLLLVQTQGKYDATNLAAQLDLLPAGTELLEKLGKGSCGTVRRIRLQGVLRAAKFIPATEGDTKAAAAQEHQLLSSFQHPGIVQTFGLFASDQAVCIVLELCSQGNVSEWVSNNGVFDFDRSLCFFQQLLGAVD